RPPLPRLLFFSCSVPHRALHSFPTRRSSDLRGDLERRQRRAVEPGGGFPKSHLAREHRRLQQRANAVLLDLAEHHLRRKRRVRADRKSTRLNSSHDQISYAVFCLKKKKNTNP